MDDQRSMAASSRGGDPFLDFCHALRQSFIQQQLSHARGFEQLGLPPRVGKSWFQAANKGRVLRPQVRHLETIARSSELDAAGRAKLEQLWLRRSADPMPLPDPSCGAGTRTLIASRIAAAHLSRAVYLLEVAEAYDMGAVAVPFLHGRAHPHHVLLQFLDPDLDSVAVHSVMHFKKQDGKWATVAQGPLNRGGIRLVEQGSREHLHQAAVHLFDAAHGPFVRQVFLSKLHVDWLIAACLREAAISLLIAMSETAQRIEEEVDLVESKIPRAMRVISARDQREVRDTMDRYVAAAVRYKKIAEQMLVDRIARGLFIDTGEAHESFYGVDLKRAKDVSAPEFTSLRRLVYSVYSDDCRALPEMKVLSQEVSTGEICVSRLGLRAPRSA